MNFLSLESIIAFLKPLRFLKVVGSPQIFISIIKLHEESISKFVSPNLVEMGRSMKN